MENYVGVRFEKNPTSIIKDFLHQTGVPKYPHGSYLADAPDETLSHINWNIKQPLSRSKIIIF